MVHFSNKVKDHKNSKIFFWMTSNASNKKNQKTKKTKKKRIHQTVPIQKMFLLKFFFLLWICLSQVFCGKIWSNFQNFNKLKFFKSNIKDGELYTWGSAGSGQIGDGDNKDKKNPTLIESVTNVKRVYAGYATSFAVVGTFNFGQILQDDLITVFL